MNMMGGASFPIESAPAFGISSSPYVVEYYSDIRTPFVLMEDFSHFANSICAQ